MVGAYLSNILVHLQVHDARLRETIAQTHSDEHNDIEKSNLICYLYRLGELYALVANLFEFARGREEFSTAALNLSDFHNAYGILNIFVEEIFIDNRLNLQDFTKRALERDEDFPSTDKNDA